MTAKVTLTFLNGSLKGRKREFSRSEKVVIGRAGDCDLPFPTTLEYREVSRRHCELSIDPPAIQVRDLGSRNGTFVNGINIGQRPLGGKPGQGDQGWVILKEGDELRIGPAILRVDVSIRPEREPVRWEAGRELGLWPLFRNIWARTALNL
jgi:pSer/pThr/pTyr-binding forkhead associated (FHA) protein